MRWWLLVVLCSCDWLVGLSHLPPGPDAPPPGAWARVAVGSRHTCASDHDGQLSCWGESRETGLATPSLVPARVDDAMWTAIAIGGYHTCAVSAGSASCWGINEHGQVTGSSGGNVALPTVVNLPIGTPPVDAVAAGVYHSCAIAGGQLWCWGDPAATGGTSASPQQIGVGTTWRSLAAGGSHTCAIDDAGMVGCWGANNVGQAPGGGAPLALPGAATAIAAGPAATCAIVAGQVWCWGNKAMLYPGNSGIVAPTQILNGNDWTDVAVGNQVACAIRAGTASCWGVAYTGAFGDGTWSEIVVPPATAKAIAADAVALSHSYESDESACVISNGNISCWGDNLGGQLGTAATLFLAPYTLPSPAASWEHVATGDTFTCASDTNHLVSCWGGDDVGQISGMACTQPSCDQPTPIAGNGGNPVEQMIAGNTFMCMRSGTTFTCRGANESGQLGIDDASLHQHDVTVAKATGATGGYHATCALIAGSPTVCWGSINGGSQPVPAAIPNLPEASVIGFGRHSSSAILALDGERWYWGYGYYGDLGDGVAHSSNASATPPTAAPDGPWTDMVFEDDHACGIVGGKISCFGTNYTWESDPRTTNSGYTTTPTTIQYSGTDLTNCTTVAVGGSISCGICNAKPYCWGYAQLGRLGRGLDLPTQAAADLVALPTTGHLWRELAIGGSHACALSTDGLLACWGTSVRGEIGDGSHGSNVPVAMPAPPG